LRIQVSWPLGVVARRALHRIDVAGQQLFEAQRLRALGEAPAACAARTSSMTARRDHLIDTTSILA